ncbi:membrane protein [Tenuifilaceae bacterium CYCD]|nr:membrane protein [Tenuifilaceae bacterium CYCD]
MLFVLNMSIIKRYILFLGLLFISFAAKSQQDPQFSQILFNPMSINPGYAGSLNMIGFGAINKLQWTGFGDGAPVSTAVSINAPIAPFGFKSGIGLSILNDKYGFNSDLGISFAYAARFKFKVVDGTLGVGINGGVVNNTLNPTWTYPDGTADNSIPQEKESSINFDLGLGLFYNTENMFFGVSATHLNEAKTTKSTDARYTRQFYVTGGYLLNLSQAWQFEPSVLITTDIASSRYSINSIVKYNKKIWGGVSYRIGEAITGMVGVELFNGIKIGYAYDYSTSRISKYNNGSHEFMLGYNFQLKKEKPPQQYKSIRFL